MSLPKPKLSEFTFGYMADDLNTHLLINDEIVEIGAIQDPILICDCYGEIQSLNQAAVALFEYSREEAIGQSIDRLLENPQIVRTKDDGSRWYDRLSARDIPCQTKSGKTVVIWFSCSEIGRATDALPTILCIGRDMTERQQAELQLRQQGERERLLRRITWHVRQSLNLQEILTNTVADVREFLNCDRVSLVRLYSKKRLRISAESLATGYASPLGDRIDFESLTDILSTCCQKEKIIAMEDIPLSELSLEDLEGLSPLPVKDQLVIPISIGAPTPDRKVHPPPRLERTRVWGLLTAHHCQSPRMWQEWEIDLLEQLTVQVAIAIQQAELHEQLQAANRELKQLAISDGLMQIANRRHFNQSLQKEWKRLTRERLPLSIILCDIDYFKLYNDTYGHLAGDTCLQQVARVLRRATQRPADLAARYGGEEFVIMLPNTDLGGAIRVTESIRSQIRRLAIAHINSLVKPRVTLSFGVVSTIPHSGTSPESLIRAADLALYRAKALGRDRYCANEGTASDPGLDRCQISYYRAPISES